MILYRILAPFIGLIIALRGLWAVVRGTETPQDLRERLIGPAVTGPAIWVHGASVGEMNAARPVISALAAKGQVLVTTTTLTGRARVRSWAIPGVTVSLAPLDWQWVSKRLVRKSQISGLVIIENELWPNRIVACHRAKRPVLMINARMSAKSAGTWTRFGSLARTVLSPMRIVAPQDAASAERLRKLGVAQSALIAPMNLKGLYAPDFSPIPAHLERFKRNKTFLAAATHDGEEDIILDAFAALHKDDPARQLIIAPRHPVRSQKVAELATARGFSCAYRSSDDPPDTAIYLADTIGDMHLWYRLAGAAFIGGSLVNKGGHTPYEPAAYGCPIVHGPYVANFADAYAALGHSNGAVAVKNSTELMSALREHVSDDQMAARAKMALEQPDLGPLLLQIDAALNPGT